MAIPNYQSILLPLLKLINDKQEHSLRETIEILADEFHLTDEERKRMLSIIEYMKPAHTHLARIVEPPTPPPEDRWILGESYLGEDTVLTEEVPEP